MLRSHLVMVLLAGVVALAVVVNGRYLPTRGDDSRLEEIKEMLAEVLGRVAESGSRSSSDYDKRFLYKGIGMEAGDSPYPFAPQ
ncbi:uncharacterized protein LOC143039177 [Oratosquilla oratoria]|uniref:uncharacterized protein LOC143039177 n=1 Tax=Oratosquilla oratoria TaxID=337810 RepID=UPI003F7779D8